MTGNYPHRHGPALQEEEKLEHVANQVSRHEAGTRRPATTPQVWVPVPPSSQSTARTSGHSPAEASRRHLRSRVLLAPSYQLQIRLYTEEQDGILDWEVRGQSEARSPSEIEFEAHGLASNYDLGVPSIKVEADRNASSQITE